MEIDNDILTAALLIKFRVLAEITSIPKEDSIDIGVG